VPPFALVESIFVHEFVSVSEAVGSPVAFQIEQPTNRKFPFVTFEAYALEMLAPDPLKLEVCWTSEIVAFACPAAQRINAAIKSSLSFIGSLSNQVGGTRLTGGERVERRVKLPVLFHKMRSRGLSFIMSASIRSGRGLPGTFY
jgi:hypothetical protein